MAGFARRILERFKPSLRERLEQSSEAKKNRGKREVKTTPASAQPRGELIRPGVEIHTIPPSNMVVSTMQQTATANGFFDNVVTWRSWNQQYDQHRLTTGTVTSYDDDDPWIPWNTHHCNTQLTASTASNDTVWVHWNQMHTMTAQTHWVDTGGYRGGAPRVRETPAQLRAREEQEAQYRREQQAANARYDEERRAAENRRKEAEDRAMKLLISMLDEQQRADLKRDKHFFVEAPSGRLYRINYGTHGNVKVVDRVTRKVIESLCIQPDGVPAGDANLMQKLLIETAEETFRAHANITLENGGLVRALPDLLNADKLAKIIPLRRAA